MTVEKFNCISKMTILKVQHSGPLNLTIIKKTPGQFYRWFTEGGFSGSFQKNAGGCGARYRNPNFFPIFFLLSRVPAASSE